jgi:hypothetical protein
MASGLCEVLVAVGVRHAFVHLNLRAHRWLTSAVAATDPVAGTRTSHARQGPSRAASSAKSLRSRTHREDETLPTPLSPQLRLALVPAYIEAALESHPDGTSTKALAFATASVLTALGQDPDERAQGLAVMAVRRIAFAVDERVAGRPKGKRDGPKLAALLFTSLKAVPLPALPQALETAADVVERAPALAPAPAPAAPPSAEVAPLTHAWMVDCLFGVISRTEDPQRRLLLAKWFLEHVQGMSYHARL